VKTFCSTAAMLARCLSSDITNDSSFLAGSSETSIDRVLDVLPASWQFLYFNLQHWQAAQFSDLQLHSIQQLLTCHTKARLPDEGLMCNILTLLRQVMNIRNIKLTMHSHSLQIQFLLCDSDKVVPRYLSQSCRAHCCRVQRQQRPLLSVPPRCAVMLAVDLRMDSRTSNHTHSSRASLPSDLWTKKKNELV